MRLPRSQAVAPPDLPQALDSSESAIPFRRDVEGTDIVRVMHGGQSPDAVALPIIRFDMGTEVEIHCMVEKYSGRLSSQDCFDVYPAKTLCNTIRQVVGTAHVLVITKSISKGSQAHDPCH